MTDVAMTTLTKGSVSQIYHGGKPRHPVLQVTELKVVTSVDANAPRRIKCKLSDGEQWGVGMMNSEMAQMVIGETLKQNGCIKLKNYMVNQLGATKMCIVVDAEVLSEQEAPIGEPVPWTEAGASAEAVVAGGAMGTPPKGGAAPAQNPGTAEGSRAAAPLNGVTSPLSRPQGFGAAPAQQLSAGRTVPIESLNPYNSRWTIKARVVSKGDKRTYESPKTGPGSVFSFDICDESGEMRVTVWREAADRFFPLVEEGRVYLISKGQLKIANKKYSNLNAQYEMSLGYDGIVQLCADEPASMPKIRYSFVPISEMANKPPNAVVDVIGIVSDVSPVTKIMTKAGKELSKRTAKLADDSGMSIEITIWGSQAERFPDDVTTAVSFKGARVTEWNERSLGTNNGTSFEVDPDNEEAARLKAWHEQGGASDVKSLSVSTRGDGIAERDAKRSSIADLAEPGVGTGEKPTYVNVLATLSKINPQGKDEKAPWYSSCPKCQKKVIGDESSGFNCDSCGWSGGECLYRYILPMVVNDGGGAQWTTAFNDIAEQLLGKSATELKRLKDSDTQAFDDYVAERQFKRYVMTMRAKEEVYQDKARLKVHVIRANPVNYAQEAKTLLADVAKYDLPAPAPAEASEAKPMEAEEVKQEA